MARLLVSVVAGLLFGLGLALSGMTQPARVLGFLDPLGAWDPTLLFVLGGAVGVTVVAFRFRVASPCAGTGGTFPSAEGDRAIDRSLVGGAALFGVGWGISGYCPGPGVSLLASPTWETWVFLPAMLAGIALHRSFGARKGRDTDEQDSRTPASAAI